MHSSPAPVRRLSPPNNRLKDPRLICIKRVECRALSPGSHQSGRLLEKVEYDHIPQEEPDAGHRDLKVGRQVSCGARFGYLGLS